MSFESFMKLFTLRWPCERRIFREMTAMRIEEMIAPCKSFLLITPFTYDNADENSDDPAGVRLWHDVTVAVEHEGDS